MTKSVFKSWTLWFNGLFILGMFLQWFAKTTVMPADVQAMLLALGNFLLRFKTSTAVSVTTPV